MAMNSSLLLDQNKYGQMNMLKMYGQMNMLKDGYEDFNTAPVLKSDTYVFIFIQLL